MPDDMSSLTPARQRAYVCADIGMAVFALIVLGVTGAFILYGG